MRRKTIKKKPKLKSLSALPLAIVSSFKFASRSQSMGGLCFPPPKPQLGLMTLINWKCWLLGFLGCSKTWSNSIIYIFCQHSESVCLWPKSGVTHFWFFPIPLRRSCQSLGLGQSQVPVGLAFTLWSISVCVGVSIESIMLMPKHKCELLVI